MYKLVIGDRDTQELTGLRWLISKYSFPISIVETVSELAEIMRVLEKELPDILFIELDMIPRDKWTLMKTFIDRYSTEVIAVTAEPTFERATEAIEIGALDLMVKPLSPLKIKNSLQKACRNVSDFKRREKGEESRQTLWYKSLFIDDELAYHAPVYLMKTEERDVLNELRHFIGQFNFSSTPLVFSTTDRIVVVFEKQIPEPIQQAQRFLREWEQISEESMVIAVHQGTTDHSLHQIYMKLRKVMEVSFFTGYQQVLQSNNEEEWYDIDPFLTLTEQRHWIYMLEESRMDELKGWMYEHFYGMKPPYPEPGLLRTRLTSILAQIRRFMIRKGRTDKHSEVLYKEVFESILYSPILYRIVQDLILFLTHLLKVSVDFRSVSKRNVIEETLTYIDEHYSDPALNLKEVADYVLRNPAYLSHTLTQNYGQSFREIVGETRIYKAKELLTSTEESIQAIASHVGFKSPNYFSRVFKKSTGKTPGEYRKE